MKATALLNRDGGAVARAIADKVERALDQSGIEVLRVIAPPGRPTADIKKAAEGFPPAA